MKVENNNIILIFQLFLKYLFQLSVISCGTYYNRKYKLF